MSCEEQPNFFVKDPDSTLDYGVNWDDFLDADIIISSSWTVPADLTNEAETFTDTLATIWLSGGIIGSRYTLVNTITTNSTPQRVDERSIIISIKNK